MEVDWRLRRVIRQVWVFLRAHLWLCTSGYTRERSTPSGSERNTCKLSSAKISPFSIMWGQEKLQPVFKQIPVGPSFVFDATINDVVLLIDLVQQGISEKVAMFAQAMGGFFCGFIIAYIRSWRLALAMSSILPLIMITGAVMHKFMSKYMRYVLCLRAFKMIKLKVHPGRRWTTEAPLVPLLKKLFPPFGQLRHSVPRRSFPTSIIFLSQRLNWPQGSLPRGRVLVWVSSGSIIMARMLLVRQACLQRT